MPLLKHLPAPDLSKLTDVLSEQDMKRGQVIVEEGQAGDTFYIGRLAVSDAMLPTRSDVGKNVVTLAFNVHQQSQSSGPVATKT